MKKVILIGLSALTFVACQPAGMRIESSQEDRFDRLNMNRAEAEFREAAPQAQNGKVLADTTSDSTTNHSATPTESYLAYRYGYGLVMPSKSVKATSDKHIQICRDAGPAKCQVTGSNTNTNSQKRVNANLSLRAEPEWLAGFIAGLKSDVAKVDGRIQSETTSVEDLTRVILDTDARLKAQNTLRTRLENLLATRNAELTDLLALERELARVQGEIESATTNLKALRARVSMSIVNISYSSERVAVSSSSLSPIKSALKDFVYTLSNGISGVIYFFAYMLPWMIFLILPSFFAGRWFWRRRTLHKAKLIIKSESETT